MRASICTWRTGMSSVANRFLTSSSLVDVSVTNSWLVRGSAIAEPRSDRKRVVEPVPPPELLAICVIMSVALA
ncbi:hypothetical protein D3C79_1027570 [compost metagenome]